MDETLISPIRGFSVTRRLTLASLFIFLFVPSGFAYVDPGFLSSLYQLGYLAVFGFVSLFIFRPSTAIKNRFRRFFSRNRGEQKGESSHSA